MEPRIESSIAEQLTAGYEMRDWEFIEERRYPRGAGVVISSMLGFAIVSAGSLGFVVGRYWR